MIAKRCGTCHFAKMSPQVMQQDITKRICWGAPPNAFPVQRPGQPPIMQMIRPVVSVSEDACALYQGKDAEEVMQDTEDMRAIQQMNAEARKQ